MIATTHVVWTHQPNSPNYVSNCGAYHAVYKRTVRGFGVYWVFHASERRRIQSNALCVGGLPGIVVS